MIRQQLRLQEVDKILTTDTGVDLVTNREIVLSREVYEAEDYVRALHHVIKSGSGERHRSLGRGHLPPNCRGQGDQLGRNAAMTSVAHLFYHWNSPSAACALPDKKDFVAEVDPAHGSPVC